MTAGQTFERYQIIRQIGRGSMGTVYLAVRQDTGQQIALKIVNGGPHEEDKERIAVEETGAKLQQELGGNGTPREPRMISVHRVFHSGDDLGIEMEYVEGEDLYATLQRGPLDPQTAAGIAAALCEMLDNLGRVTSFVHGDLKPRNVRVMSDGQVKVLDFGIAKALATTRPGTFNPWQSAPYCSPERLDASIVDAKSDLWSIGVMLYEMVAGHRPFPVPDQELRKRLAYGPDPLPPSCPAPLRNIIFRMLAYDPAQRYHNPGDCAADLHRFLNNQPVLAVDPDPLTRRTVSPVDDAATRRTVPAVNGQPRVLPPPLPGRFRRKRWMAWVRLGVLGAIILAVIAWFTRQRTVSHEAADLRTQLESHQISAPEAWSNYTAMQKRSSFPPVLYGVKQSLKSALVDDADHVIEDYRREQPTAREGDWNRAAKDLEHALEINPGDKQVIALLDICQGHLDRIRAHGAANKQRLLNSAIGKFEEAAKLTPDSRDPYLGLARIYFYDFHDYDKGMEMIGDAANRGHPIGPREKAQMADSLRDRGMRLYVESRRFMDIPDQRRQYLQKAREDLQSAAQQYASLGDFVPRADAIYRDLQRRVASIDQELSVMNGAPPNTVQSTTPVNTPPVTR